jgi:hypothetical protein
LLISRGARSAPHVLSPPPCKGFPGPPPAGPGTGGQSPPSPPAGSLTTHPAIEDRSGLGTRWGREQNFGHGYLKPKYDIDSLEAAKASRIVNRYVINQHSVITEFLDKYPMLTRKYLDYLD